MTVPSAQPDHFVHDRMPAPEAWPTLRYDLPVDSHGGGVGEEVSLNIPRAIACTTCNGAGLRPSATDEASVPWLAPEMDIYP